MKAPVLEPHLTPSPAPVAARRWSTAATMTFRLPTAAALLALVMTTAALGRADAWFVVVAIVVALALSDRQHSVLASAPAAVLVTATCLLVVLVFSGSAGLSVLASTPRSRALLAVVGLVLTLATLTRGPDRRGRLAGRDELVVCLPAALLLMLGAWLNQQELSLAVGGLLSGWDSGAHVLAAGALARTGDLSYDADAYPRGLHALVALFVTAEGPLHASPGGFERLLLTQSMFVWGLHSMVSATVALGTLRLSVLRGLAPGIAAATAMTAGLATLTPSFFNFTMMYGFHTTVALAFVLAVVSLEVLSARGPALGTALLAIALTAAAHTYQFAMPVVAFVLVMTGVRLLRTGARSQILAVVIGAVPLALAAWPPAWSVLVNTGVATASANGAAGPLPAMWLAVGVASTALLARKADRGTRSLVAMVSCLVLVTVSTAWLAGASLTDYYPRKLLWHVALLTVPLTAVAGATALRRLAGRTKEVPFARITTPAVVILIGLAVTALAVPGPYMATSGRWSVADQVVVAIMHPHDEDALCTVDSKFDRQIGFRLLGFYAPVATTPPPTQATLPQCAQGPTVE